MKKKIVILTVILIALTIPAALLNARQGVFMGEQFYMPRDNEDNSWRYGSVTGSYVILDWCGRGTACSVRAGNTRYDVQLDWTEDWARFEFDDGEILEGHWTGDSLIDAEGKPLWMNDEDIIQIVVEGEPEPPLRKYTVACALCKMDRKELEHFAPLWLPVFGVLIYVVGALNILFPEKMHFLGTRWRYENAELSEAGYAMQVFGGIVALIGAAAFMYLPMFI